MSKKKRHHERGHNTSGLMVRQHGPPTVQRPKVSWSDIDGMLTRCKELNVQLAPIADMLRNKELVDHVEDKNKLEQYASILSRDLKQFTQRLDLIQSMHNGKSGPCNNPDELMDLLSIHEQYLAWVDQYTNTVLPVAASLFEMFRKAAETYKANQTATVVNA